MADPFAPLSALPATLTLGATWAWRADGLVDDPAAYSLAYSLAREDGTGETLGPAGVADGAGYLVTVAPAESAGLTPGRYLWAAIITRTSDGAVAFGPRGVVEILPDPSGAAADRRTANRRILDAITATLEGRAVKDAESFTIEGRSIARTPLAELQKLRARYLRAVAQEEGRGGVRWTKATMR